MAYYAIYNAITTTMQSQTTTTTATPQPASQPIDYVTPTKASLKFKLNGHEEEFCKLLQTTGAVVAGGFMTDIVSKCNQNKVSQNPPTGLFRDCDVFCEVSKAHLFDEFFVRIGMKATKKLERKQYPETTTIEVINYDFPITENNANGCVIERLGQTYHVFNKDYCDVQLIKIKQDPKAHVKTFDITVCQVFFDGVNVVDMTDGDLQAMQFHVNVAEFRGHLNRIAKYIMRGFEWKNKEILPDLIRLFDGTKDSEMWIRRIKHAIKDMETAKGMTAEKSKIIELTMEIALLKTQLEDSNKKMATMKKKIEDAFKNTTGCAECTSYAMVACSEIYELVK